ncbi:hypothetical protein THMIRHAS_04890 [Thiosulfatimonas sediminis]|uniref:Uncharacterized protein n=1 Tax=Thiosulfatimonas sediminis TaxID=2675054 RepID=A0A6F8PSQ2_9GAMM|nr:hypothetical protein [Thiosulfatimonas sediminis]BBP45116.1 hypothetical protein THMIRHAS_04890 [Thiosulfatimonas sediminis]
MTQQEAPEWLSVEVAKGIQLLMALRLKRAPFAGSPEDVYALCEAWLIALAEQPISWDQPLDAPRIERAFRKLASTVTEWPSPAQLISCMPKRQQASLPHLSPIDEASRHHGREQLKSILARLQSKAR